MFDSDPSFARLRRDQGAWKIFFFTSDAGWSRALMQALDRTTAPAAPATPAAAATPTASAAADARIAPGTQPPAY